MEKLTKAEQARIDHALAQIDLELNKQLLMQDAINRIQKKPTNAALEAAAKLLHAGFEIDIDGGLLYRGAYYPDRAELAAEIIGELTPLVGHSQ